MNLGSEFEIKGILPPNLEETLFNRASLGPAFRLQDRYLDTKSFDLFLNAVFLRIRNDEIIEVKHNYGLRSLDHIKSYDHAAPYPLTQASRSQFAELLTILLSEDSPREAFDFDALFPFVTITKVRREGAVGPVVVALDDVDGLGKFVELEVREEDSLPQLLELAESLCVTNLPLGYVELYLREHHPALYRRGRFVMPSDRQA